MGMIMSRGTYSDRECLHRKRVVVLLFSGMETLRGTAGVPVLDLPKDFLTRNVIDIRGLRSAAVVAAAKKSGSVCKRKRNVNGLE